MEAYTLGRSWDAQSVLTGVLWDIYPVLKRSKPEKLSEVCKQAN